MTLVILAAIGCLIGFATSRYQHQRHRERLLPVYGWEYTDPQTGDRVLEVTNGYGDVEVRRILNLHGPMTIDAKGTDNAM